MKDIDVVTYFKESSSFARQITSFAANSIERSGISTMDELAGKSDDEIKRIRYMGEKCLPVAIAMRDKYVSEKEG